MSTISAHRRNDDALAAIRAETRVIELENRVMQLEAELKVARHEVDRSTRAHVNRMRQQTPNSTVSCQTPDTASSAHVPSKSPEVAERAEISLEDSRPSTSPSPPAPPLDVPVAAPLPVTHSATHRSPSPGGAVLVQVDPIAFKRFLKRVLSMYEPHTLFIEALSRWAGREAEGVFHYAKAHSLPYSTLQDLSRPLGERSASPSAAAPRKATRKASSQAVQPQGRTTSPSRRNVIVRHSRIDSLERNTADGAMGVYHSSPKRDERAAASAASTQEAAARLGRIKRWPQTGGVKQ